MPQLSYDRTVPAALIDALAPGSPFHELVEVANRPYDASRPLDLRLRAVAKNSDVGYARIYLGTTQVGALRIREGSQFRFDRPTSKRVRSDPEARWREWQSLDSLTAFRSEILEEVQDCIKCMSDPPHHLQEGQLQTAIAKSTSDMTMIDREVAFSFATTKDGEDELGRATEASRNARQTLRDAEQKWALADKPFGGEIDALAIDGAGQILVIEVKSGNETSRVGWTPAQVAVYLTLVRRWIEQDPKAAREALHRVAQQYVDIGMISAVPHLSEPLVSVPVIALSAVSEKTAARERIRTVRAALAQHGEPLQGLKIWEIDRDTGVISDFVQ